MKKTTWLALGTALCLAPAVVAVPISIPLDQNDFPPFGDPQVVAPLNAAIAAYNLANGTSLPESIDATPDIKVNTNDAAPVGYPQFPDDTLSITLPVGDYNYVFFHWGGPGGGTAELYYLGDLADGTTETFNAPSQNGLSFYSFYDPNGNTPVPDSGSAIALFGAGMMATVLLARRVKRD